MTASARMTDDESFFGTIRSRFVGLPETSNCTPEEHGCSAHWIIGTVLILIPMSIESVGKLGQHLVIDPTPAPQHLRLGAAS
jgi:hypothetical protein